MATIKLVLRAEVGHYPGRRIKTITKVTVWADKLIVGTGELAGKYSQAEALAEFKRGAWRKFNIAPTFAKLGDGLEAVLKAA